MISAKYSEEFAAWSELFSQVINEIGSDDFYSCLCNCLAELPEMAYPLVFYFPKDAPPIAIHSHYIDEEYKIQIERYIEGPYILDPYYRLSEDGCQDGVYRLKDIAPDNYKRSEYYRRYYKAIKAEDELAFIHQLPNGDSVHISINHESEGASFSKVMVQFLKTIAMLVISTCNQHWRNVESKPISKRGDLHNELLRGLKLFGSSLLTQRELATLALILQGHSNQSAADRLGVALSTVKLHRKHIYQKLDIGSQSELFHLFIDSLTCLDPDSNEDPLPSYMSTNIP